MVVESRYLEGLWQDIVKAKYLRNKTVASVQSRFNDSPCWKALLKVKYTYMIGTKVVLGNGDTCRLWKDPFLDNIPLWEKFPNLFDLCQTPNVSLNALDENFAIPFKRNPRGENLEHWTNIKMQLLDLELSTSSDSIQWLLNQNKLFFTISVYLLLERNLADSHNR
jgi:hypothetical protein